MRTVGPAIKVGITFIIMSGAAYWAFNMLVKGKSILKTGTTAALNKDTQFQIVIFFFDNQITHLRCCCVAEFQRRWHL